MKSIQLLLAFALICLAEIATAQVATVIELTGNAQAIPGAGTPRNLRQGDMVNQGEAIVTATGSSVVLRFDDDQFVALSSSSRVVVTSYVYNRQDPAKSNVTLSLMEGGMRAVTGKIGKQNPAQVTYRTGDSTIRVLGTDVTIGTVAGNLSISVTQGQISFTFQGKTTTVNAGEGVDARTDGSVRKASLAAFVASLTPELKAIFSDMDRITLDRIIRQAGQQDIRDNPPATTPSATGTSGSSGSGGAGGGSASTR